MLAMSLVEKGVLATHIVFGFPSANALRITPS